MNESYVPFNELDVLIDGHRVELDPRTGLVEHLSPGVRYLEMKQVRLDEYHTVFQRAIPVDPGIVTTVRIRVPTLLPHEREMLDAWVRRVDETMRAEEREAQRLVEAAVAAAVAAANKSRADATAAESQARAETVYYPIEAVKTVRDFALVLERVAEMSPNAVERYEWHVAQRMIDLNRRFDPDPDPADLGWFTVSLYAGYGHQFSGLGGGVGLTWNVPLAGNRHFLMDWYYSQGGIDGVQSGAYGARLAVQLTDAPAQTGPYLGLGIAVAGIGTNSELSFGRTFTQPVEAGVRSAYRDVSLISSIGLSVSLDYMFGGWLRIVSDIGIMITPLDDSEVSEWPVYDLLPDNDGVIGVLSASVGLAFSLADWL